MVVFQNYFKIRSKSIVCLGVFSRQTPVLSLLLVKFEGRRYDEHGNLVDWWQPSSVNEFNNRTECLVKKYSSYRFHTFKVC